MKIAIYNPYLNTLGGGEKYVLDIASFFLKDKDQVNLFWSDNQFLSKIKERYNLNLKGINFLPNIFQNKSQKINRLRKLATYDYLFYVTDGSLFYSLAKKNLLIIQSPAHIPPKNFINNLKFKSWQKILCYSEYIKKYILQKWQLPTYVLPPAVAVEQFQPGKKENLILSVGRFSKSLHNKKQDRLVNIFKKLSLKVKNYRLVLAGGLMDQDKNYFLSLKELTKGYQIELFPNLEFRKLQDLYGKAKIYWHAAGFLEDLNKFPERAEHFGISTVEAMAAGCVPIVYRAGGQLEIVKENKNGYFWETENELINKTIKVINQDNRNLANQGRIKSQEYKKENFNLRLKQILWP